MHYYRKYTSKTNATLEINYGPQIIFAEKELHAH
jgi:hypothetical protein